MMDLNNPVIQLCLIGTQAEFEGRLDAARAAYRQAWGLTQDDYEACVAAHYIARLQSDPEVTLHWNQVALARAEAGRDERTRSFYPSLYLNLGHSYEVLGNDAEAQKYYALAAELGFEHQVE
jgi:tetratricopeptide (TPR) repeat protein